ncbi:MAG: FtsW/RodA/SpoVE family cell cycle protein, partial [Candidatus Deferrimicrobium sp.]
MTLPSKWARMDWPLLINALALCAIGLLNVYSGTRVHGVPGTALVTKQLAWILLGVAAFFTVYLLSDGFIESTANGFFLAVLLLLVVVLLVGRVRGGAQRWIAIGAFNFQPSEFAKIAVTLALARYFSGKYRY